MNPKSNASSLIQYPSRATTKSSFFTTIAEIFLFFKEILYEREIPDKGQNQVEILVGVKKPT